MHHRIAAHAGSGVAGRVEAQQALARAGLRDLVGRIESLGYRGPWSIELFRPEYWTWDPVHLARVAREKMAALFQ